MIGTGNPDEGELRPQLLDRFGLYVEISTVNTPQERLQLALNRTQYDLNPEAFYAEAAEEQDALKQKLRAAKAYAAYEGRTEVTDEDVGRVVGMCLGHRTRKDPLAPLGGIVKVQAVFKRIFADGLTYEDVRKMQEKSQAPAKPKEAEEGGEDASEKDSRAGLKKGAWKGL